MKKILLAIAAVGAIGAALPAMADPWDYGGDGRGAYDDRGNYGDRADRNDYGRGNNGDRTDYGRGNNGDRSDYGRGEHGRGGYGGGYGYASIEQRIRDISLRIERGTRDGSLNGYESRSLRAQLDGIQRLEYRYRRDGFNSRERADLNARLNRLSYQVRGQQRYDQRRW